MARPVRIIDRTTRPHIDSRSSVRALATLIRVLCSFAWHFVTELVPPTAPRLSLKAGEPYDPSVDWTAYEKGRIGKRHNRAWDVREEAIQPGAASSRAHPAAAPPAPPAPSASSALPRDARHPRLRPSGRSPPPPLGSAPPCSTRLCSASHAPHAPPLIRKAQHHSLRRRRSRPPTRGLPRPRSCPPQPRPHIPRPEANAPHTLPWPRPAPRPPPVTARPCEEGDELISAQAGGAPGARQTQVTQRRGQPHGILIPN